MTNGVDGPRIIVERSSRAVSQGHHPAGERQAEHDRRLMAGEEDAGKKDENRKFGPTGHKGHGQQRRYLFAGLRRVRAASTPGTAQPPAMPPPTMNGITEQPCSPKIRKIRSSM